MPSSRLPTVHAEFLGLFSHLDGLLRMLLDRRDFRVPAADTIASNPSNFQDGPHLKFAFLKGLRADRKHILDNGLAKSTA